MLFTSGPVHSHLAPMFPLATAARARGHEVVFATGADAARHVEKAGLTAVPAGLPFAESIRRYRDSVPGDLFAALSPHERLQHVVLHSLIGINAPAMADDLVPFAREWRPDLVVSNLAEWAGEVAAAAVGAPHVLHGFGSPKSNASAPLLRAALTDLHARWEVDPARGAAYTATPYLDIWPEELRPEVPGWLYPEMWPLRPESVLPLATSPPPPPALSGLPYERTVYVTLGTTHNNSAVGVLAVMIEALRDEGVNLVVTIGPDGDPDRFGPQPAHVRVERYIPQQLLLPHCDLVVCHAGAGSVLGALAHGKPLVMLPVAADHHELAGLVEAGGAGLTCPAQPTSPHAVRDAFRRLGADPSYRANAARIGGRIGAMPRAEEVVPRLEEHVRCVRDAA